MTVANENAGPARRRTIQERFDAWIAANPEVLLLITHLAWQAKSAGRKRCGMKELWEVARWHMRLHTRGDEYRMNNDYTAPMARLIVANEPDIAHLFETRRRRSQ